MDDVDRLRSRSSTEESISSDTPNRVDGSDAASRDLAERFVGLALARRAQPATFLDALLPDRPRRTYQRATGLDGEPLALHAGWDATPATSCRSTIGPLDACRELQVLMEAARWLDPTPSFRSLIRGCTLSCVGAVDITTEWDGGLLIAE